ncbi:MAG TPA: hypothetical protein VLT13_15825, partial [Bacteroidota bacterium]|nr:hypothetical protein [Bacteroidota bacterium]
MKRVSLLFAMVAIMASAALAQYPDVMVRQLQQVPAESLAVADGIANFTANSAQPRWTLQLSRYMANYIVAGGNYLGDTVRVTGLVVVPPGLITYTAGIWTMLLY